MNPAFAPAEKRAPRLFFILDAGSTGIIHAVPARQDRPSPPLIPWLRRRNKMAETSFVHDYLIDHANRMIAMRRRQSPDPVVAIRITFRLKAAGQKNNNWHAVHLWLAWGYP
jgi:hypothetical protein